MLERQLPLVALKKPRKDKSNRCLQILRHLVATDRCNAGRNERHA